MSHLLVLTMEETFIVTGIVTLAVGIALGFLVEWIFSKEQASREEEQEEE